MQSGAVDDARGAGGVIRDSVLQDADLLIMIFAELEHVDHAAACVCASWAAAWSATDSQRRGLRGWRGPHAFPSVNVTVPANTKPTDFTLSVMDDLLYVALSRTSGPDVQVIDNNLSVVASFNVHHSVRAFGALYAAGDSLYVVSLKGTEISRLSLDGSEVHNTYDSRPDGDDSDSEDSEVVDGFYNLMVAKNSQGRSLLFCIVFWKGGDFNSIIAFDEHTLEERFRFAHSDCQDGEDMMRSFSLLGEDKLIVGLVDLFEVYNLEGAMLSTHNFVDLGYPEDGGTSLHTICCSPSGDRLYFAEGNATVVISLSISRDEDVDEDGNFATAGEVLQTHHLKYPEYDQFEVGEMVAFGRMLIQLCDMHPLNMGSFDELSEDESPVHPHHHLTTTVVALKGI